MNEFKFLSELYEDIYCWLASNTPGEYVTKQYFKNIDKKVWSKIANKFKELEAKKFLSDAEKEFLDCKYVGKAYRIISYYRRRKGHVYLINYYQSCSKSLNGIENVKLHGNVILIELFSSDKSYSIDLFKVLEFMIKNKLIIYKDEFDINHRNVLNLEKYYNEEEVLVIISKENIKDISIHDFKNDEFRKLEKNKWFRNNM